MSVAKQTLKGIAGQYTSDPDAFLLLTGAALSASRTQPLRGVGTALLVYGLVRQADRYADLYAQSTRLTTSALRTLAHATNPAIGT